MSWWGRLWNLAYLGWAPWDIGGPRPELVHLVKSGKLKPCRAIDLGCGTGENVIYLAQQDFDVIGADISSRAIAKARRKAQAARVSPTFITGDMTNLTGVEGPFDLVVDSGCLHSLFSSTAREGYVQTLLGRRRFIPDINSQNRQVREGAERMAINMPVQGTSADIIKVAMLNLYGEMGKRRLQSKLLLQVHDELVFEVPAKDVKEMYHLLHEELTYHELEIPLTIDVSVGPSWTEQEKLKL